MQDCKQVSIPFMIGTKLSLDTCLNSDDYIEEISNVSYASVVGSLMYTIVCTRPDIAQAVGDLSKFMSNPGKDHWNFVKMVLRYLQGTFDYYLVYHGTDDVDK